MAKKRESGVFVSISTTGETVRAFVPHPLPPDPPLQLTMDDYDLMEKANRALGRLDGLANLLPETSLFIYLYIRKEAVLSSQIEGTQSSLSDLLLYESDEAPGVPINDVQEVSNYVAAMEHGIKRLNKGFPLCLRLVKEMHEILLSKGRGSTKQPGEFRHSQKLKQQSKQSKQHAQFFNSLPMTDNDLRPWGGLQAQPYVYMKQCKENPSSLFQTPQNYLV